MVGARKFLIAYNINLNTADLEIAKRIAKAIRFSSGGFRYVKSMGVPLASRNLAQVSMNLTDFEQTPIHRVFEAVRAEAARYGAAIVGSEIVGLIPKRALEMTAEWYLQVENFHPRLVLENRLAEATTVDGLNEFLDELAAPTATPGRRQRGGCRGSDGGGVGCHGSGLAKLPADAFEADRKFFAEAVKRDAASYEAVRAAYKTTRRTSARRSWNRLCTEAAMVPLEVAEAAAALKGAAARPGWYARPPSSARTSRPPGTGSSGHRRSAGQCAHQYRVDERRSSDRRLARTAGQIGMSATLVSITPSPHRGPRGCARPRRSARIIAN